MVTSVRKSTRDRETEPRARARKSGVCGGAYKTDSGPCSVCRWRCCCLPMWWPNLDQKSHAPSHLLTNILACTSSTHKDISDEKDQCQTYSRTSTKLAPQINTETTVAKEQDWLIFDSKSPCKTGWFFGSKSPVNHKGHVTAKYNPSNHKSTSTYVYRQFRKKKKKLNKPGMHKTGRLPGSGWSMQSYSLTYSWPWKERIWQLCVLYRGDLKVLAVPKCGVMSTTSANHRIWTNLHHGDSIWKTAFHPQQHSTLHHKSLCTRQPSKTTNCCDRLQSQVPWSGQHHGPQVGCSEQQHHQQSQPDHQLCQKKS